MQIKNKEKIDFKHNLATYWTLLKGQRRYFFLIILLVFITAALELTTKFILKILVDQGTGYLEGVTTLAAYTHIVLILLLIFLGYIIIDALFTWLKLHYLYQVETQAIKNLKQRFFNHLIGLDYNFHTTHKTGSLISKLIRGGGAVEDLTDNLIFSIAPFIAQVIIVTFALSYFEKRAIIIVVLTSIVFIAYSWFINRLREKASLEENDTEDKEKAHIADIFTNFESIKYFGKEKSIGRHYEIIAEKTKQAQLKSWNYWKYMNNIQALILNISSILIIYPTIVKIFHHEATIGTLIFIYTTYTQLYGPLYGFSHGMRQFYRNMSNFQALFKYNKYTNTIKDQQHASKQPIKEGTINFSNIYFSYKQRKILNNFNLNIPKNKKIALVGPSGAGKSTIIRLLYRFYDLQEGNITIDEKNIKDYDQEHLRGELSIVPQECVLFDDTIWNNIKFSRPEATTKEVWQAIKFAQLDKTIKNFPQKEKTIVGERGIRLSGGEKQRVSIARALLAKKKILVLDEATSSLDSETEHDIQEDLKKLMQGKTTIIIAHRLSTIMHADKIIVLDKGKIVQEGKHAQLIRKPGLYKRLWNLQRGGYL
ncbi:MAG: ABC transporter ATP-binding protein [Nanoarchaeota archaeon]|nr:ABC transporter ATP-binding protein [Nanoarchaeota archaeon]